MVSYLCVAVQQPDRLVCDLQKHLLGPDLVFGVEEDQLLDGIVHRGDGLGLVHDERGEMLRRKHRLAYQYLTFFSLSETLKKRYK